jgi:hypothetical protein
MTTLHSLHNSGKHMYRTCLTLCVIIRQLCIFQIMNYEKIVHSGEWYHCVSACVHSGEWYHCVSACLHSGEWYHCVSACLHLLLICCCYFVGIILVHDLTNRKSQQNLQKWLGEVISKDTSSQLRSSGFDDFDPEQFVGSTQVICLCTYCSILHDAVQWIWLFRTDWMLQISIKTWGNDQYIL